MSKNDITGDEIKTKVVTEKFRQNFEAIFGKPLPKEEQEKPSASKQDDTGNVRHPI